MIVIGEDLGTVPDEAREVLHRFGILSYRLLYFEQDNSGRFRPPQEYPRDALVSATTHDLPTLAGFWVGQDIEARREAGLLTDEGAYRSMRADRAREKQKLLDLLAGLKLLPDWFPRDASQVPELVGELHNAIVGFLTSTPSKLMVLNQEDLLKQVEQQNLPGSTAEYPNWRRKMKCTVEELWTSGEIQDFAQMFRLWLERTGAPESSEVVFYFVEQAFFMRVVLFRQRFAKLLEELALLAGQFARNFHVHLHKQVAPAATLQARHSQILQTDARTGLNSFREFHLFQAVEGQQIDLRSQHRLRNVNGNRAQQIVSLPLKMGCSFTLITT